MTGTKRRPGSTSRILRMLVAGIALAVTGARADTVVKDFDLFVDPPTAFVFVKLPQGWKFVGKVDAQALAELPASVHTSLLPVESEPKPRLAEPDAAPSH